MTEINHPTLLLLLTLSVLIICLWAAGMFFPMLRSLRIASILSLIIVLGFFEVLCSSDSLILDYIMYPAVLIAVLTSYFLNYVIGYNISPHESQWPTIAIASMFIYCTLVLFAVIVLVKYIWKKLFRKATTTPPV
jgi:hypothetical protein